MSMLKNFTTSIKELFYPAVCLICGAHIKEMENIHLCHNCIAGVRFITSPLCSCCGEKFTSETGENHLCSLCLSTPYSFSKARSIVSYNDTIARLIHSLKYGRKTAALATFKAFFDNSGLQQEYPDIDFVLPVPLHIERLKWRGYNQAMLLAKIFFDKDLQKVNPFLLTRVKNTAPQTALKGRQRRTNLTGAFAVPKPHQIASKKILLIDDVFTTGTTLNECAKTLLSGGAKDVQALTLARVTYH